MPKTGTSAAVCFALLLFGGVPASASELPVPERATGLRLLPSELSTELRSNVTNRPRSLWFWPKGGRIFLLSNPPPSERSFQDIRAYDDTTLQEVGRITLPPSESVWASGQEGAATVGMPHTMVVDDDGGRLFAFVTNGSDLLNPNYYTGMATGRTCRTAAAVHRSSCALGLRMFDAATLQPGGFFPLTNVRLDNQVYPVPRALAYEPPDARHHRGKLLLLIEEHLQEVGGATDPDVGLRQFALNQMLAVQIDADSGQPDWSVRLEACHGRREQRMPGRDGWARLPHPATIFRSPAGDAVWVGCHSGGSQVGTVVRMPLDARGIPVGLVPDPANSTDGGPPSLTLRQDPAAAGGGIDAPLGSTAGPEVFVGPSPVASILSDSVSERIVMRTLQGSGAETWMVFDGRRRAFLGRVGTGDRGADHGHAGIDPSTGRLYVYHGHPTAASPRGLYVADIRRTPLPQALFYPEFADVSADAQEPMPLSVQPAREGRPPRLFVSRALPDASLMTWRIIQDASVVSVDTEEGLAAARTLNLDEVEGVTQTAFDGTARGFGVRAILAGGAVAASRVSLVNPVGWARGLWQNPRSAASTGPIIGHVVPGPEQCTPEDREAVAAFVGPEGSSVVDADGARGAAVAARMNGRSMDDLDRPASRCVSELAWDRLWERALFGRPPTEEPGLREGTDVQTAECVSKEGTTTATVGDAVAQRHAASVACAPDNATGYGYFRGLAAGPLTVAEALSSFRIYRDPDRGIVSRIESVARGVALDGVLRIDTVRGVAESWANGRPQPVPENEREDTYEANCDLERTAGTCLQRHLFGVWTPGWSCGPCGDEQAFTENVNRALSTSGQIRLREPDPEMARGSEDGYLAAIQRSDAERFSDLTINNDLLPTIVPTLEIIRYAPVFTPPGLWASTLSYQDAPGRQIYQFAGVEVSSSYGIECLLVYDEVANTCAAAAEPPASLTVDLRDLDGEPLAGGAFELRADTDADGVLGLVDTLVPNGACVTGEDGVGTCSFPALEPGSYLVTQVAAPPGYTASSEPFPVELVSGEARTVSFTNGSGIARIDVTAKDEAGAPLSGASFAVYPDPDADGKVAADATPAASCETDAAGVCAMSVPPGSYVLVQTAAPGGLEGIEPVAFVISAGGQVASVDVVNYAPLPPDAPPAPESALVTYDPAPPALPPTLHTVPLPTMGVPEDTIAPPVTEPRVPVSDTVRQIVRAPGDALRLLARQPMEGIAFAAALALLALAWVLVRRREMLRVLTR